MRHPNLLPKVSLLIILSLVITSLAQMVSPKTSQAQSLQPSVCMSGTPNIRYFPDITVQFRAIDSRLRAVPNLNLSSFNIQDSDTFPVANSLNTSANGAGLNLYFVIDQGNRTDQRVIKAVLNRFADMFMTGSTSEPGTDRVTIVTTLANSKREHPNILLEPTQSKTDVIEAIQALPDRNPTREPLSGFNAIQEAINLIRADGFGCARPNIIVAIMGVDVLRTGSVNSMATDALSTNTFVNIIHTPHDGQYLDTQRLTGFAQGTYGGYFQISPTQIGDEFSLLDPTLFADINSQRLLYTLQFRSSSSANGQRPLIIDTNNPIIQTSSNTTSYSINLQSPTVTLTSPATDVVITRTSTNQPVSGGYLFDVNTLNVEFQVAWGDGYNREISSYGFSVNINSTGAQSSVPIVSTTNLGYQFEYDLRTIESPGSNPVTIQVSVTDEFGLTGISEPVNIRVENIVPLAQMPDPTAIAAGIADEFAQQSQRSRWQMYVLYAVIIILILTLFLMRRQIKRIATSGIVGQVVGQVRKTLVGGLRKGKHLAKLRVLDGPTELLNQELTISTETVRLGRDPAQADFTFFANASSSISGLHARLERNNGSWRIVALSKSGSETFLDENPIPFFEPVPISSGQMIRMGYYAQQPVKLEFITVGSSSAEDPRVTDIHPETHSAPVIHFPKGEVTPSEGSDDSDDSFFSKYRKD